MMPRPLVEVVGLREVEKTLGTVLPREARNITRRTVVSIARDVRKDVRSAAPERTGRLRRAIRHRRRRSRGDQAEASVDVILERSGKTLPAPHWHLVEFGTVKMAAQPFIRPTVARWRPRMPAVYRERFGKELEKELAKRARRTGR